MDHSLQPQSVVVRQGAESIARLQQLGFSRPALVREALQDGASAARSVTTEDHPVSYPGTRMWAETTASLSKLGGPEWQCENFHGVDLVTNHRRGVAVIVTSGDTAAGSGHFSPNVRYPRQEIITGLVNGELDTLWDAAHGRAYWQMWFLLHHLERREHIVPAELSRPYSINSAGNVTGWVERNIVPEFNDGGGFGRDRATRPGQNPTAPVVDVKRRAV